MQYIIYNVVSHTQPPFPCTARCDESLHGLFLNISIFRDMA